MSNPVQKLTPEQAARLEARAGNEGYVHRCLVGLDQFANVLIGGKADETISSRCARASVQGKWWGMGMSSFLNLFQANHGAKAVAGDMERAKNIESTEQSSGILPPQ